MSRPADPTQATAAAPGRADQWIRRTAAITVAGLADRTALLPAARTACDDLHRDGHPLPPR